MKGGVIIIGSLFWDDKVEYRKTWWKKLDFNKKVRIPLPIRYGRSSSENREYTYSMVFSKTLESSNSLGFGYFVPFKNEIFTTEEFISEIKDFAKAEGFKGNRIAANWGTVCIKINPNTSKKTYEFLIKEWNNLVKDTIENRKQNQTIPNLNDFGEINENLKDIDEEKSITENWMLNVDIDIFKTLENLDFILTTSNALRHRNSGKIKYPNTKEIAKAIYEGNYYEYFLRNRLKKIVTSEDKIIAKLLRKKYKISLKKIRKIKNWV